MMSHEKHFYAGAYVAAAWDYGKIRVDTRTNQKKTDNQFCEKSSEHVLAYNIRGGASIAKRCQNSFLDTAFVVFRRKHAEHKSSFSGENFTLDKNFEVILQNGHVQFTPSWTLRMG